MRIKNINRKFNVGVKKDIKIKYLKNIHLKSNEQITFILKKIENMIL